MTTETLLSLTQTPKSRKRHTPHNKGTGKKALAVPIIKAGLEQNAPRQQTLGRLVTEVGMTAAGASSYYAAVKKGEWK